MFLGRLRLKLIQAIHTIQGQLAPKAIQAIQTM